MKLPEHPGNFLGAEQPKIVKFSFLRLYNITIMTQLSD